MAKPDKSVHVAVLHHEPECFRPKYRCLTFGDDVTSGEALKQAEEVVERLSPIKGMTFIERTGQNATQELGCDICEERSQRHGYLLVR